MACHAGARIALEWRPRRKALKNHELHSHLQIPLLVSESITSRTCIIDAFE